jgi:hypothetical protein
LLFLSSELVEARLNRGEVFDCLRLLRKNEDMIGGGGSIASTLGTENTSFATGWPMRRHIAKSEKDWSIGFVKCITNESSAGAVEN